MAPVKLDVLEALLPDEEYNASLVPHTRDPSNRYRRLLQQKSAIISHALVFLTTLLVSGLVFHFNARHVQRHCKSDLVPSKSTQPFLPAIEFYHAEAAPLDPIANQIRYTTQSTSVDYWSNELLWGEPSPESEIAWNNGLGGKLFIRQNCFDLISLLSVRRFRLHPDEARRLNVSDSVRLKPGDDLAVITGVLHNLHCLVGSPFTGLLRA